MPVEEDAEARKHSAESDKGGQRPSGQVDVAKLRQLLNEHFNDSELQDLCFDIGIDYESLPGPGKSDKARGLVAHARRHGQTTKLLIKCRESRPDVDWHQVDQIISSEQLGHSREPTHPSEVVNGVDPSVEQKVNAEDDSMDVTWLPNFADEHLRILEDELMKPLYWEELGEAEPLAHESAVAKYFYLQINTIQHLWKMSQEQEKIIEDEDRITPESLTKMTLLLSSIQKKADLIGRAIDSIPDHPLYIVIVEAIRSVSSSSDEVKEGLLENQTIEEICFAVHELANTLRELESQLQRMQQYVAQELMRVLGKEQFEDYQSHYPQQTYKN
jgi:Effector-associated domain 7